MSYLKNLLVSIDQLGNTLAGGNPDNTISSRVGYYNHLEDTTWYWQIFEKIVDFTFYPIDGPHHCHEAYHNDAGEEFDEGTKNWAIALLAILIIGSCAIISVVLYVLYIFGVVSPKNINRYKNIEQRLLRVKGKLHGAFFELEEHDIEADDQLKDLANATIAIANNISIKINET